jgi:hypothetical protein
MTKLSSYQKLKYKNDILRQCISTLVNKPNSIVAEQIRLEYAAKHNLEQSVFFGEGARDIRGRIKKISTQLGVLNLIEHPKVEHNAQALADIDEIIERKVEIIEGLNQKYRK